MSTGVLTGTDVSLEIAVSEALDERPACESANHAKGVFGHQPDEPAVYMAIAPCGHDWLCCAGWLTSQAQYATTACSQKILGAGACGGVHPSNKYVYIPLDVG